MAAHTPLCPYQMFKPAQTTHGRPLQPAGATFAICTLFTCASNKFNHTRYIAQETYCVTSLVSRPPTPPHPSTSTGTASALVGTRQAAHCVMWKQAKPSPRPPLLGVRQPPSHGREPPGVMAAAAAQHSIPQQGKIRAEHSRAQQDESATFWDNHYQG